MAFHWSHRDVCIVLPDDEEMALVGELAGPKRPGDVAGYNIHRHTRRKYEALIIQHLKQQLAADPEAFSRKYWYRTRYFQDATDLFRLYIDAYGRFTRNVIPGRWREPDLGEDIGVKLRSILDPCDDVVVSVIRYSWWRRNFAVTGEISFPVDSVQSIAGTPTNFVLVTDTANLKFAPDFVRVTVADNSARRAALQEDEPDTGD